MYADLFWNWLEKVASPSADVSRLASFSPEYLRMKDYLRAHLVLLGELKDNPVMMENKKDMEVLVSLYELMMQFRTTVSIIGSMLDKVTLIVLSKKVLSRRSKIARFLYKPDVWKEPEDDWSNNSQGAVNSGHGKAKENNKGMKNKGGKKGKK
ncbi:hypothetical protein TSUD_82710 [Trifolium subterraneum]|uniref:Uncharacterized protein n=1 Tax=Trifolium subterraneum TaxID=3900 RepID=A0A2Z6MES0_TRISU|nr:hypothetical protein TSUD_82710 [Trifolium subterraneum]